MANQTNIIFNLIDNATKPLNVIGGKLSEVAGKFKQVSEAIFFYESAFQTIQGVFSKVWDMMVSKNEELNQQILGSQASLVAVSDIFKGGLKIDNATRAIESLAPRVRGALDQIAKDSLELVGVTSGQLVEPFQILLTNAQQITNQSKQFRGSIEAAGQLVPSFAATLGTLQIPLAQASQEISSIVTSQIDMNSRLAKSLGITNDMVNNWKGQGVLVDKLIEKMDAFKQGNALAARSIDGIYSNIKEVIEITSRKAGTLLMEPVISVLDVVYQLVSKNQDQIQQVVVSIIQGIVNIGTKLNTALTPIYPILGQIGVAFLSLANAGGTAFYSVLSNITDTFIFLSPVIATVVQPLASLLSILASLANSPFGQFLIQITIAVTLFKQFQSAIGNVSTLFSGLFSQLKTNITSFTGIKNILSFDTITATIGKSFSALGNSIKSSLSSAINTVFADPTFIKNSLSNLSNNITQSLSTITNNITKTFANVPNSINQSLSNIKSSISTVFSSINLPANPLTNIFGNANSIPIPDALTKLSNTITPIVNNVKNTITNAFSGILANITPVFNNVKDTISNTFSGISNIITETSNKIGGFVSNIKNSISNLPDTFKNVVSNIGTPITNLGLQIEKIGIGINAFASSIPQKFQSLGLSIASSLNNVPNQLSNVSSKINQSFSNGFNNLPPVIKNKLTDISNQIASSNIFKGIQLQSQNLGKSISNSFGNISNTINQQLGQLSTNPVISNIGTGISNNFRNVVSTIGQSTAALGVNIQGIGQKLNSLGGSLSTTFSNIGKSFQGLSGLMGKLKPSDELMGFLSNAGTTLLLQAAITAVTLAFDTYSKITEAATKNTKEFNKATQEQIDKLKLLEQQRGKGQSTGDKSQEEIRLKQIEDNQNILEKFRDGLININNQFNSYLAGMRGITDESVLLTGAQSQLIAEQEDFNKLLTEHDKIIQGVKTKQKELTQAYVDAKNKRDEQVRSGIEATKADKEYQKTIEAIDKSWQANIEVLKVAKTKIEGITPPTDAARTAQSAMIKEVDGLSASLNDLNNVEIRPKQLPELGNTMEQLNKAAQDSIRIIALNKDEIAPLLTKQIESIDRQIEEIKKTGDTAKLSELNKKRKEILSQLNQLQATGDVEQFKKNAEILIDVTKQQVEMGSISIEEAERRYTKLSQLTTLDKENQQKALTALRELRKKERDDIEKHYKDRQDLIQAYVDAGYKSEAKGQEEILKLREESAQKRLDEINNQIKTETENGTLNQSSDEYKKLVQERQQLQIELTKVEGEGNKNRRDQRNKDFDEQTTTTESHYKRRLISERNYQQQLLKIAEDRAKEQLKQIEEDRKKLQPDDKEGLEALAAKEQEILSTLKDSRDKFRDYDRESRLKSYDQDLQILQSSLSKQLISQRDFAAKSLEITRQRTNEELKQIDQDLKSNKNDPAKLKELNAKRLQLLGELATKERETRQQINAEILKDYDEQESILKASFDRRLISEDDYAQKSLEIARKRTAEELKQIADERAKTPKGNKDALEALAVRESEARAKLFQKEDQDRKRKQQQELENYDERQKALDLSFGKQLISEDSYNKKSLELTKQRGQKELQQIQEDINKLAANDTQGRERLESKANEIRKRLIDADKKELDRQRQQRLENYDERQKALDLSFAKQLISEDSYNKKSLALSKQKGNEELKQIQEDINKLAKDDIEGRERLEAKANEIRKRMIDDDKKERDRQRQQLLENYDERQKILDLAFAKQTLSEDSYYKKSLQLTKQRGNEELKQIQEDINKLAKNDIEGRERLEAKANEIRKRMIDADNKENDRQRQQLLENYDERQKALDLSFSQKLISEDSYNKKSLQLIKQRGNEELKQIQEDINDLAATDIEGRQKLEAKANEIRKRMIDADEKDRQRQRQQLLEDYTERQSILQSQLDQELISQKTFAQKSLQISKERLNEQLKQINEDKNKLAPGDTQGLQKLLVKESQVRAEFFKQQKQFRGQERAENLKEYDQQAILLESNLKRSLTSQKDYSIQSLEIARNRAAEELKYIAEDRSKTSDPDKLKELAAKEAKILGELADKERQHNEQIRGEELKDFDIRNTQLNSFLKRRLISEQDFSKLSLENERNRINTRLKFIDEDLKKTTDPARIKELLSQQDELRGQLAENDRQYIEKNEQLRLQSYDRQQSLLQSNFDRQLISEESFYSQSLALSKNRLNEELKQINDARSRTKDPVALAELDVKEAQARAKYYKEEQDNIQRISDARIKSLNDEQTILDAKLSEKLISEQDYSNKSKTISESRIKEQFRLLDELEKKLAPGDIEGHKRIEAQRAALTIQRVELETNALKRFNDTREKLITDAANKEREIQRDAFFGRESIYKKSLDTMNQLDIQRQIQNISLLKNGLITKEQINEQDLNNTRQKIALELQEEINRLNILQSLPSPDNPKEREQRENAIRNQRLKTSELTLSLMKTQDTLERTQLENIAKKRKEIAEQQLQDAKLIAEYNQKVLDSVEEISNRRKAASDQEYQIRKMLFDTSQSDYNLAMSLTDDAEEKKRIQKESLQNQLDFLNIERERQQQSLNFEKQKLDFAIKRKDLELQMKESEQRFKTQTLMGELSVLQQSGASFQEIQKKNNEIAQSIEQSKFIDFEQYMNQQQAIMNADEIKVKQLQLNNDLANQTKKIQVDMVKLTDTLSDDLELQKKLLNSARTVSTEKNAVGTIASLNPIPNMMTYEEYLKSKKETDSTISTEINKMGDKIVEKHPLNKSDLIQNVDNIQDKLQKTNTNDTGLNQLINKQLGLLTQSNQINTKSITLDSLVASKSLTNDAILANTVNKQSNLIQLDIFAANNQNKTLGEVLKALSIINTSIHKLHFRVNLNNSFTNNIYGSNQQQNQNLINQINQESLRALNKFVNSINSTR